MQNQMHYLLLIILIVFVKGKTGSKSEDIAELEKYCNQSKKERTIKPKIFKTNSHVQREGTRNLFFLCHSLANVSLMSFTSEGYSYTEFKKRWPDLKAYTVSCGIGVLFKGFICTHHEQRYQCFVRINNTNMYASNMSTYVRNDAASTLKIRSFVNNNPLVHSIYLGDNLKLSCNYTIFAPELHFRIATSFMLKNKKTGILNMISEVADKIFWHQIVKEETYWSRSLSIYNISKQDEGEYICLVRYGRCTNRTLRYNLTVSHRTSVSDIGNESGVHGSVYYGPAVALVVIVFIGVLLLRAFRTKLNCLLFHAKSTCNNNKADHATEVNESEAATTTVYVIEPPEKSKNFAVDGVTGEEDDALLQQEYDAFICYSSFDREWVKNTLLTNLEERGVKACIDYRDFLVGEYIITNMTEAIYSSRKTVAVLSPDFLGSVYCKQELQTALSRMANHQVIPILYRPCDVPNMLKDKTYLDWCHADVRPFFWEQLEKAIRIEPKELERAIRIEPKEKL